MRAAMEINTSEKCPSCDGTGKISPSLLSRKILRTSCLSLPERKIEEDNTGSTSFIEAYLTKGLSSRAKKWSKNTNAVCRSGSIRI